MEVMMPPTVAVSEAPAASARVSAAGTGTVGQGGEPGDFGMLLRNAIQGLTPTSGEGAGDSPAEPAGTPALDDQTDGGGNTGGTAILASLLTPLLSLIGPPATATPTDEGPAMSIAAMTGAAGSLSPAEAAIPGAEVPGANTDLAGIKPAATAPASVSATPPLPAEETSAQAEVAENVHLAGHVPVGGMLPLAGKFDQEEAATPERKAVATEALPAAADTAMPVAQPASGRTPDSVPKSANIVFSGMFSGDKEPMVDKQPPPPGKVEVVMERERAAGPALEPTMEPSSGTTSGRTREDVDSVSGVAAKRSAGEKSSPPVATQNQFEMAIEDLTRPPAGTSQRENSIPEAGITDDKAPVGFSRMPEITTGEVSAGETVRPARPRPLHGDGIIRQVLEQVQVKLGKGQSEMRLELKPEHLGPLSLKVSIEDGLVTANFTVARGVVKEVLQANLAELRNALEQQGLKVDQFNVMMGNSGEHGQRFSNPHARHSYGQQYTRGYQDNAPREFDSSAAWLALRGTGSRLDFLA